MAYLFGLATVASVGIATVIFDFTRTPFRNVPRPSEKRRLKIFDLSADTYDSRENFFEWITRIKYQRKKVFSKARGRVLEIGAGTGRNLEVLNAAPGVTSLTCIDTSGPMCEVLASKIDEVKPPFPVQVIQGDAADLPFEDKTFDSVISSFAVCAVEHPERTVEETRRVLKEGGRFMLLERGLPANSFVRWLMKKYDIYPNPNVAWELGIFEDLDVGQVLTQGKFHLVGSSPSKILTLHALSARRGCSVGDRKLSSGSRLGLPELTDKNARVVFRYTPEKGDGAAE
ncbi:putative methyltransferase domain-containing protein [Neospora caninum Liverpool]|uniref:Methyltransferase domain-containing protein,putative n=1 Tax=Neospora caninum (strain Liverpool) TaxID=572307 RepID=F0VQH9_NEOCL|nr:putative methyltransferase domain-containing protein [Neospora caninum Liverpool]CBZ55976.1 putative methyltransferase domain-containing protein [Neospora caninum Liverpool]CEL70722.1 TPA: methyltransferase domain-containing protein,putative [Neospora caninum Liverpool]|eukprot:XP_003886002.1 putative methyltransferase domain-containing protein [Neospora caninum Liverpool]